VDGNRILVANPVLGVVKYKGRACAFSDVAGMMAFLKAPGQYFLGIREACYRSPELIQLLRLHEDFPQSSLFYILEQQSRAASETAGAGGGKSVQTADGAAQTPVHFVENGIERGYEWNEWKLRRDALQMADLMNKATTSAQTSGSTFRREQESQTYLPKNASTNTAKDARTQTQIWKRYIRGLRGSPNSKVQVVDFKYEL